MWTYQEAYGFTVLRLLVEVCELWLGLDTDYLSTLSPDIVPAATRLPEPLRAKVLDAIRADLSDDSWQSWNLSRARTR